MRQIVALRAEAEAQFVMDHPHWTMERRVEDKDGIVWLSFRVDQAAERKADRPLAIASRALLRDWTPPAYANLKPIYLGKLERSLSECRTVRYLPLPHETTPVVVVAPPLLEVPGGGCFGRLAMALAAASGAAQVQFSGVVPAYIAGPLVTLANPVYYSETVTSAGVTVGGTLLECLCRETPCKGWGLCL